MEYHQARCEGTESRNPSESDRIYDIDVMLNNTVNTDLAGDHVLVDELEFRKEFSTKYKVKNSRMLVLKERLDTNLDRDQARYLYPRVEMVDH